MIYTGYELLWLFFAYSFFGWVLETANGAMKQRRFVNRGLVNGPFCVIYGVSAAVIAVFGQELSDFWLFAGAAVLTTVAEWAAGHMIEGIYHEKWWDYSGLPWNLDGYICLPMSLFWGLLGFVSMRWGNRWLLWIFDLLPPGILKIGLLVLAAALLLDISATLIILSGRSKVLARWRIVDAWFTALSRWIEGRIQKAYVGLGTEKKAAADRADRCSFHELILLFVAGAFLGDVTETIFCRITAGVWMSRSSVVYGPFSIVWGLAIALVTALLYRYRNSRDGFLFAAGTILGGVYEYFCSVFTELMFGTVFWDYSHIPFNLGGRINLLYCFFWGIAAVFWFKGLYPLFVRAMKKIALRPRKLLAYGLLIFMTADILISCGALIRSAQRREGIPAVQSWQQTMDEEFDDERLKKIYPNALEVE